MKNLYSYLLLAFLFFQLFNTAKAATIAGAEISYKCSSSPGIYEVTLIVYTDCQEAPLCAGNCGNTCTQSLKIRGVDNGFDTTLFGNIVLTLIDIRDVNINPQCGQQSNSICTNMGCKTPGLYTPAFERYEFKGFVNTGPTSGFPANCCNIRFSYEACCRSNSINTGSAGQPFYTDAVVNRCLSASPCNSSPESYSDPIAAVCNAQNYVFNNSSIDPDFDSLSFAFAPSLQSFQTPVSYTSPYAYDKPMPWTGHSSGSFPAGIHCDPQTGDVMFTPNSTLSTNFTGVIAIETKQWKTINNIPTVIGITRRDMEMVILNNCPPNNIPRLRTIPYLGLNPNSPKTAWEVCAGSQLCFTVIANDTDFIPPTISDTTYLTWNNSLGHLGATFLPNYNPSMRNKPSPIGGPREDNYNFCWTPADSVVSNYPYYFNIRATDSRCPNPGTISRSFSIKVKSNVLQNTQVTIQKTDSICGITNLVITDNVASNNVQKTLYISKEKTVNTNTPYFTNMSKIAYAFQDSGWYYLTYLITQNNACQNYSYVDSVFISHPLLIHDSLIIQNATCYGLANGSIQIQASGANMPYLFAFNNGAFGTNNTFTGLKKGKYLLKVKDTNGCSATSQAVILEPQKLLRTMTFDLYEGVFNFAKGDHTQIATEEYANTNYSWTVTNGNIINGNNTANIEVEWTQTGQSIITVIANNNCTDTLKGKAVIGFATGINEILPSNKIEIYPNPTKQFIQVNIANTQDIATIELYDLQGRIVKIQEAKLTQQLDISELPTGLYLLKIGNWKEKIIKQ